MFDGGGAQAGGVFPALHRLCSLVVGGVWGAKQVSGRGAGRESESGAGGERGLSDRCGVLDVALRAWALSCRGLGAGAGCGLLL